LPEIKEIVEKLSAAYSNDNFLDNTIINTPQIRIEREKKAKRIEGFQTQITSIIGHIDQPNPDTKKIFTLLEELYDANKQHTQTDSEPLPKFF
jgi:hypothetical protein